MTVQETPGSPCIDVCELDTNNDICSGCFRTLDEIANWLQYSDQDKHRILENSKQRKLLSRDG